MHIMRSVLDPASFTAPGGSSDYKVGYFGAKSTNVCLAQMGAPNLLKYVAWRQRC
jgi:hypothetical protein